MNPINANKTLLTNYKDITSKIKHKNPLTFFHKKRR